MFTRTLKMRILKKNGRVEKGLNILISIGKQFLNNNKHIKLNTNVDTILTGIKRNSPIINTEGDALINLNIPEHLKTSQKEN